MLAVTARSCALSKFRLRLHRKNLALLLFITVMPKASNQTNLSHKVIRHIYTEIQDGRLKVGDKLTTNRALALELGISILTVQRSMKQLEAQGVVVCQRRSGTFLTNPENITSPKIQSDLIGLFVPEFSTDFHTDLLLELEEGMMEAGKMLSINFTRSEPDREIKLLRTIARQRLEALIYIPSPRTISSPIHSKSISNWVNRYVAEGTQVIFADLCPAGSNQRLISLDESGAGKMLTNKLIERGHKNIAFFGPNNLPSGTQRAKGYYRALEEAGLAVNKDWLCHIDIVQGDDWVDQMRNNIKLFLQNNPEVTGFVISDQTTAETTFQILRKKVATQFTAEQSIAALFEKSEPPFKALAWMHVPGKRMGKKICQLLLENHAADYMPGHVKIRPTLWTGDC